MLASKWYCVALSARERPVSVAPSSKVDRVAVSVE